MHRLCAIAGLGAAALVLASCSSSSSPTAHAGPTTSGRQPSVPSASGGHSTANATVPTDCSALKTSTVSAALGGAPVLDSDSEFNTTLQELHCIWYTADAVSEKLSVQLGGADDFIGFYASQEATGVSTYTTVDGFDAGRLYGKSILIAKRNGFAVAVDARTVYPILTAQQVIAVALEATTP